MRRLWAAAASLVFAIGVTAQEPPRSAPPVTLGPPVSLGAPIAVSRPIVRGQSADDGFRVSTWAASLTDSPGVDQPTLTPLRVPEAATPAPGRPYAASRADDYPGVSYVPPPPARTKVTAPDSRADGTRKSHFGEFFDGWFTRSEEGCGCFESDHCFVTFISPVTNPFIAEDPRSVTELRPIFMFQSIPNSNWIYRGGHAEFFGMQARLALTERWSLVLNKLGGVSINPEDGSALSSETGFAEVWFGPKFIFLRNTDTGTLGAAGVTFQVPAGTEKVAQDTGKLSLLPYVTFGQNFGRSCYGSFNVINTTGYSFRTDNTRSDYFVNSLHLDYDVGNLHKFFPLLELNWFHYTRSGKALPFGFEGADLVNFGSTEVDGRDNLTIAPGMRFRVNDHLELGAAAEFPLVGTRDLNAFRVTFDVILRY